MLVVGVYVNNTNDDIYGFSSKLRLKFVNKDGQIATVNSAFDENFIGKLKPEEGMLIHLEVPVRGLNKDEEYDRDILREYFSNMSKSKLVELCIKLALGDQKTLDEILEEDWDK